MLESFATKERDKKAALKFVKKLMKRHGCAKKITTDGLRSYSTAMKELGIQGRQEVGRYTNYRAEGTFNSSCEAGLAFACDPDQEPVPVL